jgi:hypothetical protein
MNSKRTQPPANVSHLNSSTAYHDSSNTAAAVAGVKVDHVQQDLMPEAKVNSS